MWVRKQLQPSAAADGVLCSVLAVNPWTPGAGHREKSGIYLSPENAIEWAAKRLVGASSSLDIVAVLLTAPTLETFTRELSVFHEVFPLPEVGAIWRRATTAVSLEISKMQIPARASGFPSPMPLSVASLRGASAAAALLNSVQGGGGGSLADELETFRAQRAAVIAAAQESLNSITAQAIEVHAVSTIGSTTGAVREMRDGIPNPDHVFSLCLVMAGDDLTEIRRMLRDE
ncbi:hypothetical protein [Klebsiella michiganensis]|uniref:hypothetical protein n=2 Tax=Klebsiella/Raoultella group TaxID=2890311 RepID=UPI0003BEB949|nr:hypothetical protein L388_02629 [Klebsiella oxytoca MGH 42]HBM3081580.1 hypothetical protein [Klebsiella michiganensis]